MRPIVFGVAMEPPRMDMLFVSPDGYRIVRDVRLRTVVATEAQAKTAALREALALSARDIELLREIATPIDRAVLARDEPSALSVAIAEQRVAFVGPIFCPGCCRRLGTGNSPALGYLERCPGCARRLTIDLSNGDLRVILSND